MAKVSQLNVSTNLFLSCANVSQPIEDHKKRYPEVCVRRPTVPSEDKVRYYIFTQNGVGILSQHAVATDILGVQ